MNNFSFFSRKTGIFLVFLAIVVFISFLPSLNNSFVNWDDETIFTKNPYVLELTPAHVQKYFSVVEPAYPLLYIPLTLLSFSVENYFFGLNPFVYHLTNLIIHLLNVALVFFLIHIVSRNLITSFLTALLFGIHPLNVESVAWVTERKDMLYAFFLLGAILAYLHIEKKRAFYFLSILLFMLSLLSKPTGVYLPFVLILMDWILGKKLNFHTISNKIPFFMLSGFISIPFIGTQRHLLATTSEMLSKCGGEWICMASLIGFAVSKLCIPYKLACAYPFPSELTSQSDPAYGLLPFFGIGILILAVYFFRYSKKVLFGIIFFVIAMTPYLASLPYFGIYFCDHYTYLASLGLFYVFSEIVMASYSDFFKKNIFRKMLFYGFIAAVIMCLSASTWIRCGVWKDSLTLWSDLISKYPSYTDAYYARSSENGRREDHSSALSDLNEWIRLEPDNAYAYYLRGIQYLASGENERALSDFNRAIQIDPHNVEAYNARGIAYSQMGDSDRAIAEFDRAIHIRPDYGKAYFNRAIAFLAKGDDRKAERDFKAASTYSSDLREDVPALAGRVWSG